MNERKSWNTFLKKKNLRWNVEVVVSMIKAKSDRQMEFFGFGGCSAPQPRHPPRHQAVEPAARRRRPAAHRRLWRLQRVPRRRGHLVRRRRPFPVWIVSFHWRP